MNRFSMLAVVCLMFVFGCGVSETVSEVVSPDTIITAAELREKWGEPCSATPVGDSEVWIYCVHIGMDGREFWEVCRPGCPQRHEMTIHSGLIVKHETVGAP